RPRAAQARNGGGHHRVRSRDRRRSGDLRAAAPAVRGVRVRVRERTEGTGPRQAHGRAAGTGVARSGVRATGGARQAVTLTRLVLAWVPVAVWFMLATFLAIPLLMGVLSKPAGQAAVWVAWSVPHAKSLAKWRLVEAAILTMFASLWFDSLGSGSWWLLFLLVGLLVVAPEWLRSLSRLEVPRSASVAGAVAD